MSRRVLQIQVAHWPALNDRAPLAIEVRDGRRRVEFRGPPYEHKGWPTSQAGQLHDALTGPHASMLHGGDTAVVLPTHEDHSRVLALLDED